jgi:type IV pilus assembly protein PilE
MIVIAIVALLATLAYPSYTQYARKAKRGDAQQLLLNWSVNQEIWRSNNPSYNGITDSSNASYIIPDNDYYNFGISGVSATAYTLTATAATSDQALDKARDGTSCTPLTLDQNGAKLPAACWE